MLLNIIDNPTLHVIAEIMAIVIGSMLLGILLGYLHWGEFKKKSIKLGRNLDLERDQALQLKEKLTDLENIKSHLENEILSEKSKYNSQARTIYDLQQKLFDHEKQVTALKDIISDLQTSVNTYEKRLQVITEELRPQSASTHEHKTNPLVTSRANYEHVSKLLGRQVTENDLTVITGIGPKTALLLHSHGIHTWKQLADLAPGDLQKILSEAGGPFRSIDASQWPKQALMASLSEWRKLRIFQESLK